MVVIVNALEAALMVRLKVLLAVWTGLLASVTVTWTLGNVPAAEGVPLIRPVELIVSGLGRPVAVN